MSKEVVDLVNAFATYPFLLYIRVLFAPLLVVDWLFSSGVEITYAWKARWNLGLVLYFMARYIALVEMVPLLYFRTGLSISPERCHRLSFVCSSLQIFVDVIAEIIMTIRVWALWNRSKAIGIFLLIMSIVDATAGTTAYMLLGHASQYIAMDSLSSVIPGCFPAHTNVTEAWSFVPMIVHQMFIFVLTAIKCVQHYRAGAYGTSLINTFYSDGLIYFALLIAFSITNFAGHIPRSDLPYPRFPPLHDTQFALHSILSSRMLLHLRQESDRLQYPVSLASLHFTVTRDSSEPSMLSAAELPTEMDSHNNDWFVRAGSVHHRRTVGSQVEA